MWSFLKERYRCPLTSETTFFSTRIICQWKHDLIHQTWCSRWDRLSQQMPPNCLWTFPTFSMVGVRVVVFFLFVFLVVKTQLVHSLQGLGTFPGQVSNKITSQVRETVAVQSSIPQAFHILLELNWNVNKKKKKKRGGTTAWHSWRMHNVIGADPACGGLPLRF